MSSNTFAPFGEFIRAFAPFGGFFSTAFLPAADAWTPLLLSSLQLLAEGDSGTVTTAAGSTAAVATSDPVGKWGSVGSPNLLTQSTAGNRATLILNGLNGLPIVRFDASKPSYLDSAFTLPQPAHYFFILRATDAATSSVLSDGHNNVSAFLYYTSNYTLTAYSGSSLSRTGTDRNWHLVEVVRNGVTSKIVVDDLTPVIGDVGSGDPGGLILGARSGGASATNVDFAAAIVCNAVLSDADVILMKSYLRAKWLPTPVAPTIATAVASGDVGFRQAVRVDGSGNVFWGGYRADFANPSSPSHFIKLASDSSGQFPVITEGSGFAVIDGDPQYTGVAWQSDGKLVRAGYHTNGTGDPRGFVARYNANGSLDTTFGGGGTGEIEIEFSGVAIAELFNDLAINASDGSIYCVGFTQASGSAISSGIALVAVAKLTSAGILDTTFNTTGKLTIDYGNTHFCQGNGCALDPTTGYLVVGGLSGTTAGGGVMGFARVKPDGTLDSTFGTSGVFLSSYISDRDRAHGFAVDSLSRVYLTGGQLQFVISRLTAAGAFDATFGTSGTTVVSYRTSNEAAFLPVIQSNGKVVGIGWTFPANNTYSIAVARLDTNGVLDDAFGDHGWVAMSLGSNDDEGFSGTIQADGKIVVGGWRHTGNTRYDPVLLRLTTAGAIDRTFGG